MNFIRLIPSVLLYKKKLVKGCKFKNHINVGKPNTTLLALESQGADEIFLIDLFAYQNQTEFDYKALSDISEKISTPITVGGNIKNFLQAKKLFANGADKIYLCSAYNEKNKDLFLKISDTFGSQSIVAGVNIKKLGNNYITLDGKTDPLILAKNYEKLGVGEIKITFTDLEGPGKGMDLKYISYLLKNLKIQCIFEGGIGNLSDISNAISTGATNLALGKILFLSDNSLIKIKQNLINMKFNVRK